MPIQSARGLTVLALISTPMTLSTGCAPAATSATEGTICRELRADLPTYSTRDTAETLAAGARFQAVFDAVCLRR